MSVDKKIDKYYKKKAADRRAAEERSGEPEVKTLKLEAIDWHKGVKISSIALLAVLSSYLVTLWGGYVYCDSFNLQPFRTITKEWTTSLLYMLSEAFVSPLAQPLVRATYATDIAFGTISSPAVFHGDSVCIHIANCILVFVLAFKLAALHNQRKKSFDIDPYAVGAGAAILFACHPLASEAVAYISARSALLVTFNYVLALLCFLRAFLSKQIKDGLIGYSGCFIFIILAIWSGPQALTIGSAMLILALMLKPEEETWDRWLKARPMELFAIGLVALVVPFILLLKYKAPIGNGFGLEMLPPVEYIASQCKTLATYYLRVLVVPFGLSLDPPYSFAKGFSDPLAIVGAIIPLGLLGLSWKYRASLLVSFPIILFLLALLPDFLLPQPELMSDRRMYLPLLAFCIPLGVLIARCCEKRFSLTVSVAGVIVLTFIGLTNLRNLDWKQDMKLWESTYNMNKDSERSRIMRVWSMSKGKMLEAGKLAETEIKQYPDSAVLNMVLGKYKNVQKEFSKSNEYFRKALSLAEKQNLSSELIWDIQYGIAYSALKIGDIKTANEYADKALLLQPNNATLHMIKGEYYLSEDQPPAAVKELNEAHTLDRYNPEILEPLTYALIGCGTPKMQDMGYQAALLTAKIGNHPRFDLLKSYAALETGHLHEAMMYLDTYRKGNPETPEMYYVLYGVLKQMGAQEADKALQIALQADPTLPKRMRLYLNRPVILPKDAPKEMVEKFRKIEEAKKLEAQKAAQNRQAGLTSPGGITTGVKNGATPKPAKPMLGTLSEGPIESQTKPATIPSTARPSPPTSPTAAPPAVR
ncbi:MAG: hypothetical protein SGJ27_16850 [Candidatus Melainabacteria bacterium]|nr:hypothetical protein [Candidatus Melainabacteria bacterium]